VKLSKRRRSGAFFGKNVKSNAVSKYEQQDNHHHCKSILKFSIRFRHIKCYESSRKLENRILPNQTSQSPRLKIDLHAT